MLDSYCKFPKLLRCNYASKFIIVSKLDTIQYVLDKVPQMQKMSQMNLAHHQKTCYPFQPLRYMQSMVVVDSLIALEPNFLLDALNLGQNSPLSQRSTSTLLVDARNSKQESNKGMETRSDAILDKRPINNVHPFSICALADIRMEKLETSRY